MARMLSIVVPVFNEVETLEYTHGEIARLADDPRLVDISTLEIVYVDDGSTDGSAEILRGLACNPANNLGRRSSDLERSSRVSVRPIHFSRNFGHSAAVLAGLEAASGEVIAIIDADLQDSPQLIPDMIARLDSGSDVVYGQRKRRGGETTFKRFSAWAFYRLLGAITRVTIPRDAGDFRVITREVRDAVVSCRERDPFLRGIVAWVGFKQEAFLYERGGRKFGTTKYGLRKMLRFACNAILSFSSAPLWLSIWLGAAGLVGCAGISAWAALQHARGQTVSGWTSLLIGFMLGQSITIFLVGILGAYLGRMFAELQGRPRYIVRRTEASTASADRELKRSA